MTILLPLAVASLTAGCTTFSDGDAVARVGDQELSTDELEVYRKLVGGTPENADDAQLSRDAISIWSEIQVLTQLLADSDFEPEPAAIDAATQGASSSVPGFAELDDSTRDLLVDYFVSIGAIAELTPPDDEIAAWFDQGIATSGLACVSHILVETEEEAEAIVVELDDGADFATLAVERSIDPGSGANGGFLVCTSAQEIGTQFVPEFAAAAVEAAPGVPTEPVETDFGFHIIRNGLFAEHPEDLAPIVAQGYFAAQMAIAEADIRVNSRYGTNDGVNVIPLG